MDEATGEMGVGGRGRINASVNHHYALCCVQHFGQGPGLHWTT